MDTEHLSNAKDYDILEHWKTLQNERRDKESITFCSIFSTDGNYIICGTNFGFINIWNVSSVLSKRGLSSASYKAPVVSFNTNLGNIYSLCFAGNVLVSAGDVGIKGYDWKFLVAVIEQGAPLLVDPTPVFDIANPRVEQHKGSYLSSFFETNGVVKDVVKPEILYTASGDGNAYAWDLEEQKKIGTFKGHSGYLHCITQRLNQQVLTGSEDGTIKLWDSRTFECVHTLNSTGPSKWIACMAIDSSDNWMVSGGGQRFLTLWHLPSLTPMAYMPTAGTPQAVCFTQDDNILSGGNEDSMYHWKKNGKLITRVATSSKSIFSITENNHKAKQALCVSGAGPQLDIFLPSPNYGTIASSLPVKNS